MSHGGNISELESYTFRASSASFSARHAARDALSSRSLSVARLGVLSSAEA